MKKNYQPITFPKREWSTIKRKLNSGHTNLTVRTCYEYGKYKLHGIYQTPWGDLIKIIEIKRFTRAEDLPHWSKMSTGDKISVKYGGRVGKNKFEWLAFRKI